MTAFTDAFAAAGIMAALGFAFLSFLPRVEGEMDGKLVARLLLAPLCLAALILALDGVADHLIAAGGLHP